MKKVWILLLAVVSAFLIAACEPETLTVIFLNEDGTVYQSMEIAKDSYIIPPVNPEKEGYEFKGWLLDDTDFDPNTMIASSITLKPKFELLNIDNITHIVTFLAADGSLHYLLEVLDNTLLTLPQAPEKDGYDFVEWQLNGETFDVTTPITEPLILTPLFKQKDTPIIMYTISFFDGNTKVSDDVQVLPNGKLSNLPTVTKINHTFVNWYTDKQFTTLFDINTPITQSMSLYAKFEASSTGIPTDYMTYYDSAEGLTGNALKQMLTTIISKGKATSYDDAKKVLIKSDIHPTISNKLYGIYDGVAFVNKWDNAATWNREHVWPQSKLGSAPKGESHNLRVSGTKINNDRGNLGYVDGSGNARKIGSGWFPGDGTGSSHVGDHRGDVARIVLFMHVRYGLSISTMGNLDMFIRWHQEDPVDAFEIHRNNVIYSYQNNRNPFIDYPHFVTYIWG